MKKLSRIGKVYMIVPKTQVPGAGHAVTLAKYKKIKK
jgi:hypothetical protein